MFKVEVEVAEDVSSDTFLAAARSWRDQGLPENPTAWLHAVAKNKTRNYLKKKAVFDKKLSPELKLAPASEEIEIEFSKKSIDDSQLAMIFTICDPIIPTDAQIGLALNLLCGFGIQEIADAFFTNKRAIYKRLERAKERLKLNKIRIASPTSEAINERLDTVLTTLYLMFSEGHFSMSQENILRKNLCSEAMRLTYLLVENPATNTPSVNALFALMCFHSSRFDARTDENGNIVPYNEQNETLWDQELIARGQHHLNIAATGKIVSKFHLEAGIAFWHTQKEDTQQKWKGILGLYDRLLDREYSAVAALNRTYALAKVKGIKLAMAEAERLNLTGNIFYQSLLGFLSNKSNTIVNVA